MTTTTRPAAPARDRWSLLLEIGIAATILAFIAVLSQGVIVDHYSSPEEMQAIIEASDARAAAQQAAP